jgi:hypothetical protein
MKVTVDGIRVTRVIFKVGLAQSACIYHLVQLLLLLLTS